MPSSDERHGAKRRLLDESTLRELTRAANLPAIGKTRTVFDSELSSFAVRISPKGVVAFCMVYSFAGQVKRYTIGQWRTPELAKRTAGRGVTMSQARKEATVLRARIEGGEDIAAAKTSAKAEHKATRAAAAAEAEAKRKKTEATFGGLLDAYAEHLKAAGKPSWKQVKGAIKRHITPRKALAAMPAEDIDVDAVLPVFQQLGKDGKQREAEKLRAYLRAAYSAAAMARRDGGMHAFAGFAIRTNPLADLVMSRPKEAADKAAKAAKERKWALSEAELAAYWQRIASLDTPHGAMLRFHLLTGGQRVEQLSRLQVTDFDADAKSVTLLDTKGRRKVAREHVVPLIPDALKALNVMRGKAGPYLFTVSAGKAGAVYHTLADSMREVADAMVAAEEVGRRFTPGTIRKTVETRLAAKGVTDAVLARLESHGLSGVQATHYNAHDYDDEKRAALVKLRALCEP